MTDEDVQELIALVRQAQTEWANGASTSRINLSHGTIFGPFGGPAFDARVLSEAHATIASQFHDVTTGLEVANTIICDDVVCLVTVERNMVRFEGETESRPWILRSTMPFRREAGTWTMLHRHADPLIIRQDVAAIRKLLPDVP